MKKARVAELKARLSEYLRAVRKGHEVTIYDRDTPIARIVPLEASSKLAVREPAGRYKKPSDVPMPPPLELEIDPVELLLEDRNRDRNGFE